MSEEAAPPVEADQPDVEAPAETSGQGEQESPQYFEENFDPSSLDDALVPAYKQMQAAFTKKTQSVAEERKQYEQALEFVRALQDPETAGEALAALGYDFDSEDEVPQEELDPAAQMYEEWQAFKEQQAQQQQIQELDALESQINAEIVEATKHLGDLSEKQHEWVFDRLLAIPPKDDGSPDIEQAVKDFEEMLEWAQERYKASKRDAAQAPAGSAGQEKVDLSDERARVSRLAALIGRESA